MARRTSVTKSAAPTEPVVKEITQEELTLCSAEELAAFREANPGLYKRSCADNGEGVAYSHWVDGYGVVHASCVWKVKSPARKEFYILK
jgi:hypothetical protein